MKAVNELGEATSVPIILEPVSAGEMTRKKNACYLKKTIPHQFVSFLYCESDHVTGV